MKFDMISSKPYIKNQKLSLLSLNNYFRTIKRLLNTKSGFKATVQLFIKELSRRDLIFFSASFCFSITNVH